MLTRGGHSRMHTHANVCILQIDFVHTKRRKTQSRVASDESSIVFSLSPGGNPQNLLGQFHHRYRMFKSNIASSLNATFSPLSANQKEANVDAS